MSQPFTGSRLFYLVIGHGSPPHGAVHSCRVDGSDNRVLIDKLGTHPDGIAIDPEKRHLYYTNMGATAAENDGFITRCNLDGSDTVPIIDEGVTRTPKQLIIEKQTRKMYWCDREGMKVWRANLDGSSPEVLYQAAEDTAENRKDERNHCVGIAVDLKQKRILWTQKGPPKAGQGRLFTAALDLPAGEKPLGRSDAKVLLDNLPEPIDLELDRENLVCYKTDRGAEPRGNSVSRVRLNEDGQIEEEILTNHLHEAIGLALDLPGQKMFFTDLGGSIYSANLDGSEKTEILKNAGDLTGICLAKFD